MALGEPGVGYPLPWSVQTWLSGVPATDDDPGGSVAFARDLAELIQDLRAVDTRGRTFTGTNRGGDLRAHDAWMEVCFDRSTELLDVPALRRLWSVLRDLPRATPDVMTHGDLIPGNVLVQDGRLAGVIDVGDSGRPTPPWISSPPGIFSTLRPDRCSVSTSPLTTSSGSAAGPGPSSRPWASSGTTRRATPP